MNNCAGDTTQTDPVDRAPVPPRTAKTTLNRDATEHAARKSAATGFTAHGQARPSPEINALTAAAPDAASWSATTLRTHGIGLTTDLRPTPRTIASRHGATGTNSALLPK